MKNNVIKINKNNFINNIPVGLALGSGAIRGLAHIGVIDELIKNKIFINEISGSSVGSIIACAYGANQNLNILYDLAMTISKSDIFSPTISIKSFNKSKKLKKFLQDIFYNKLKVKYLEELNPKVFVVATNLETGKSVVFDRGNIIDALMSSCSVPILFPPYYYSGAYYVDGGILMPLPVSILKKRNNRLIIGVSLGFSNFILKPYANILSIAAQNIIIMGEKILSLQKKEVDILIEPEFGDIGFWDFKNIKKIIELGQIETSLKIKNFIKNIYINSNLSVII